MKSAILSDVAVAAFRKHPAVHGSYDFYPGIVTLHGMARLATRTGNEAWLKEVTDALRPFIRGERNFHSNFPNYLCGGNATAWMLSQGYVPEAAEEVRRYADQILQEAPRNAEGILTHPQKPGEDVIWIDVAFAVTPFLLFAGLALKEEAYIEDAFQQTAKMVRAFKVESTGLLNQAINMRGPGHRTQDHWSRGNGWAALALTELAVSLPEDHRHKAEAVNLFQDHVKACEAFQDENGLWRQEMTELTHSYVETSGSGLMLYALGAGLEAGLIDAAERPRFERGLKGLLAYITEDSDVFHTVTGCFSPGNGSKLEYMAKPPILNDPHAFGPVVLAMGQGHLMGVDHIERG